MPTIQAAGWPTSTRESARVRCSGATHSAVASVPAVVSTATATPTGSWLTANSAKVGAAALATDARARRRRGQRQLATEADASGDGAERQRRDPRGKAGDRAQLTRRGRRDMEVACRVRQDRRHRDHCRLSCEQAQEESRRRGRRTCCPHCSSRGHRPCNRDRRPANGWLACSESAVKADGEARAALLPRLYRRLNRRPTTPVSPRHDRSGTGPDDTKEDIE